jgi:hypothetical protein
MRRGSAVHHARPRTDPRGWQAWVCGLNAVVVSDLIDPFRRSHIFAVMGGMMVMSGDIAIKGGASGSHGLSALIPVLRQNVA